ncbi:MAG: hypothetical protein OWQ54_09270 [Sulfolobaceae archaeon]|nr:hypothetical protein [Sulfolobaceae archaeon]
MNAHIINVIVSGNECGRCTIKCSKYVSGKSPTEKDYVAAGIDIGEIDAAFNDKDLLKYLLDPELANIFKDIVKASENSPIKKPEEACYEKLAIFCCGDLSHSGYIFYNTDRISSYIDSLTNHIIILTMGYMRRVTGEFFTDLLKDESDIRSEMLDMIKNISKYVITNSIIFHERFHWAEGCGQKDQCEEEAKATAFEIKRTIDLIRGEKLNNWEKQPPVNEFSLPSLIEHIFYLWPHCRYEVDSIYLPLVPLTLELAIESIVLANSKMPCYAEFFKYLKVKNGKLGSITVNNDFDVEIGLPWIGLHMKYHLHHPYHVHLHYYRIVDNLDLNLTISPSVNVKDLKEVWSCC